MAVSFADIGPADLEAICFVLPERREAAMSLVTYEQKGPVAILTLNQPETRNPISSMEMIDALIAAMEKADEDISVHAVILTGAGNS